jgi:hypothetical protein
MQKQKKKKKKKKDVILTIQNQKQYIQIWAANIYVPIHKL